MIGFAGKYYYTVDPKGRVMIPAPFRSLLTDNYSTKLIVTNAAFDRCLHLYPLEEWQGFEEKIRSLPKMMESVRWLLRRVVASAQECELDKQGRILIPASHREDAVINGEIVVVGQIEKIELWNREEWDAVVDPSRIDRKAFESELAGLGI
ncbi:cell division protein MraZ [bacterium BMS3Bbin06]|nr:cell division protein MraZ [bacterium BMS3Abin08]GBE34360.1 cell division protein MraZ [bacterium BMS3Bbin06]HDO35448.1 division/cell wall cluster transcriptional repressor MraZ [Nitrospirota bacterium]HDY71571.1 division/cell wall cluster transcriptional repressor MraZ [Nitrospirota bacterium]